MRKSMLTMGFGLALSLGAAGAAHAQAQQPATPREHGQHGQMGPGEHRGPGGFLLKGITLSDAQKAQLAQLRENQKSQGNREELRKEMQEARDLRQKGDTAAARAKFEALRTQMEQNRERQFAAIRAILTPDQQKQFDANVAQMKQRAQAHGERGGRGQWGQGRGGRAQSPNGR